MKKTIKRNDGFSMVEMIIVLAIVAVVSAMSVISISITYTARAKEAASTFDSEIATLYASCKGMSVDVDKNGLIQGDEENYAYCIKLYKPASKQEVFLCQGYYDLTATSVAGSFVSTSTMNGGLGKNLTSYVKVNFTGKKADGTDVTDFAPQDGSDAIYIAFNRRGECIYGVGTYEFKKTSGKTVARKYIRANGSHGSK